MPNPDARCHGSRWVTEKTWAKQPYDVAPHLLVLFWSRTADVSPALASLDEGDNGAAILDGIAFTVERLRAQPHTIAASFCRLSETVDQDNKSNLNEALRLISDTNTAVCGFSYFRYRCCGILRGIAVDKYGALQSYCCHLFG